MGSPVRRSDRERTRRSRESYEVRSLRLRRVGSRHARRTRALIRRGVGAYEIFEVSRQRLEPIDLGLR